MVGGFFAANHCCVLGGRYDNQKIKGFSAINVAQPSYIPTANFKNAGAKIWSDSTCDLPEQMRKIESDFREANNIDSNMQFVWQIPYDMIRTVFLTNAKMKEEVNRYIRFYAPDKVVVVNAQGGTSLDADTITIDQLLAYSRTAEISKISPIMVAQESQVVQDIKTVRTVHGWDAGKAVLRPLGEGGKCGVIVHSTVADVEILGTGEVNNLVSINSTKILNFLYVINAVSPDGYLKKYLTKVVGRYAPVLNEGEYHVVVDTTTAG